MEYLLIAVLFALVIWSYFDKTKRPKTIPRRVTKPTYAWDDVNSDTKHSK